MLGGGEHAINSKKVDVKRAKAKPGKIFVGGLTPELEDEQIKEYFSQFGNVTECEMPFDKTKNQRKNFCFITFEREETMKELLKTPKQKIGEVEVDVKRATPKSGMFMVLKTSKKQPNLFRRIPRGLRGRVPRLHGLLLRLPRLLRLGRRRQGRQGQGVRQVRPLLGAALGPRPRP